MKSKDKESSQVLKSILSDITYSQKSCNTPNSVSSLLQKAIKKRKESQLAYVQGHRQDLASQEEKEISLLQKYLPKQLSLVEIETLVKGVVDSLGLTGPKDLGRLMKELNATVDPSLAPRQLLSEVAKKTLSSK